jgi:hypothetical protein
VWLNPQKDGLGISRSRLYAWLAVAASMGVAVGTIIGAYILR